MKTKKEKEYEEIELEINDETYEKLSAIAKKENTTIDAVVEKMLKEYIDSIKKEKKAKTKKKVTK